MHLKPDYEDENNNVITPKQKHKNSIFYSFQQFISKLLNK